MKKNLLLIAFLTFSCVTAFAQTKVNSGKNFVVYSYDDWETASSDYLNLNKEYRFLPPSILDDRDFSSQQYFTVKQGEWNFFIIRAVNSNGIWCSFCVISPEGRQTELSAHGKTAGSDDNIKEWTEGKLNDLKLRYKFLGEPIP